MGVQPVQPDHAHARAGPVVPRVSGRHDPGDAELIAARPHSKTELARSFSRKTCQNDDQKIGQEDGPGS